MSWCLPGTHADEMTVGRTVRLAEADSELFGIVVTVDGNYRRVSFPSIGRTFRLDVSRLCFVYEEMGG